MTKLEPIEIAALKTLLIAAEGESQDIEKITSHFSDTSLELMLSAIAKIGAVVREGLTELREVDC